MAVRCLRIMALWALAGTLQAAAPTMLVYGPTSGCYADNTPGYNVTVWNAAQWASATTAQFAAFNVIVFGDCPYCFANESAWNTAIANVSVWSPAVTGNVLVIGADPDYHIFNSGVPVGTVQNFVNYAAAGPGTGLYVALSCVYENSPPNTAVPLLSGLGNFTVEGEPDGSITGPGGVPTPVCGSDKAHIVAVHPALTGLNDAMLSNWHCSVHEGFDSWPSSFIPLAIGTDAVNKNFTAPDGTAGVVYILASGAQLKPIPSNTPTKTPTQTPTPSPTSTPTDTPTPCGYPGNTCTPTFTPTFTNTPTDLDIFTVNHNVFNVGKEKAVTITVGYGKYPGPYSLRIYNSAGEHIQDLDKRYLTTRLDPVSYPWDGTNKRGEPCASGIYVLYLVEPFDRKVKRLLLVR